MDDLTSKKENFEKLIKKINTEELLKYYSMKSIELFKNGKRAFVFEDVFYYNEKTGERGIQKNFCYGQWEFVQICYYSIKNGNYSKGLNMNESLFYQLLNENKIVDEILENIATGMDEIKLFEHMQCLANVQIDFQNLQSINRFNRMYQMMRIINKNSNYDQTKNVCYINFENQFEKITGIDIEKFIISYCFILLMVIASNNVNLYDLISNLQIDNLKLGFSKQDVLDLINEECRNYDFYKQSDNWNLLRYYPIVKTKEDDDIFLISNVFSLIQSFPNSIYWILRNYYKEKDSNDFTNYFGKCFEYYFQEILDYYNISYEKLKESNKKMPDWKVDTEDFIVLIEQKASLFPIDARTTTSEERYNKIDDYFDKNIVKAFKQLNSYVINDSKKTVIRICLTFEKIHMEDNAKKIVKSKMTFPSDVELNWIVNIDEMEILLNILSTDYRKFKNIIEKKIYLEKNKENIGKSFMELLKGYTNDYTLNKINHFERISDELKQKLS